MGGGGNNGSNRHKKYSNLIVLLAPGVDLEAFKYFIAIWLHIKKDKKNLN